MALVLNDKIISIIDKRFYPHALYMLPYAGFHGKFSNTHPWEKVAVVQIDNVFTGKLFNGR
ncbi:MAG: hypothetical protein R3A80_06175 [Bdellovibrionota bacterium]